MSQPGQDVPDELLTKAIEADAQYDLDTPHKAQRWMDRQRAILAAVLPVNEAMVRAKIAEGLRESAAGYRRTAKRGGALKYELERRAEILDHHADRITRGDR